MRRTLIVTLFSLALVPASLLAANTAEACSCMPPRPAVESARDVSAVFHAKLLGVSTVPRTTQYGLDNKMFRFEVLRTFKGQLDPQINIMTADNSAACGRDYGDPGSEWLIYTRIDEQGQARDNLCSRTRPISEAAEDIKELEAAAGTLDQPNEPPDEPVGPADPEPVVPPAEPAPEPQPVKTPGMKNCSVTDGETAPLGLLGLALGVLGSIGLGHRRRRR